MLETATLLALASYALVMTITPGPNNLLLMSSGLAFGLRHTCWHLAGINTGVMAQIWLVGAGLGTLFTLEPRLQVVLKAMGSIYMLWLATKLWGSVELGSAHTARPISFWQAWSFQFVNPKTWLMATTVVAVFVPEGPDYVVRLVIASLIFCLVGLPCITLWAVSGLGLRVWLKTPNTLSRVNRVMAILAAGTVVMFWL